MCINDFSLLQVFFENSSKFVNNDDFFTSWKSVISEKIDFVLKSSLEIPAIRWTSTIHQTAYKGEWLYIHCPETNTLRNAMIWVPFGQEFQNLTNWLYSVPSIQDLRIFSKGLQRFVYLIKRKKPASNLQEKEFF